MIRTIYTQDEVFVNYAHIKKITPYVGSLTQKDSEPEQVYGLIAEYASSSISIADQENADNTAELGFYTDEKEFQNVISRLYGWLNECDDRNCIFSMPPEGFLTREEKLSRGSMANE